jgi:hypothetical protein
MLSRSILPPHPLHRERERDEECQHFNKVARVENKKKKSLKKEK